MRKLLIGATVLFLFSCDQKYRYVEIVNEHSSLSGDKTVEKEVRSFSAKTDSIAYLTAFEDFCFSQKINAEMDKSLGGPSSTPVDFKLYNDKDEDISKSVSFANKEALKSDIKKQILSRPNELESSIVESNDKPKEPIDPNVMKDKSKCSVMCQAYVKKCLAFPEEADFDYSSEFKQGYASSIVTGYVDSKNAYGVKVRFKYEAYVSYNGGEWSEQSNWSCSKVILTGADGVSKEF